MRDPSIFKETIMPKTLTRLERIERFIETKIFRLPVRPHWK